MKKFLSMVLALVMTMSLVTISAGAKDFTDDSKITYKEAVDVVSTIGIVDGYEDGAFNPTNELTRGAAAKIICNLILGPTTASALSADTAPFKDVPTTNNFAGYIAYCAQQGIISGYADGTFRPAAPLTGYAFMKMLLGALGYDAVIEGFVGANWSVQVGKQALGIGLDNGNDDFVGTKAVNREEACLYVFNTLQATMVEYDSKVTANVNGVEVTVGNSKAVPVEWATGKKNDGNIDGKPNGDGFVQFAEQYFDKLVLKNGTDDFARPANIWEFKSNEVGTYAKTPDVSYTKKVEVGDIYKDLGLTKTIAKDDVSVYIDGVSPEDYGDIGTSYKSYADKQTPVAIKKGDDNHKYGANGVLTEVFFDDDDGTVTITQVNTYVAQVNKNVAATSKKDAYVQISTLDVRPSKGGNLEFETGEEFEEDSYVQYTFSESAEEVKSVMETEIVEGTATKIINKVDNEDQNNGMTLDGTEYKISQNSSGETLGAVSVKNDYTVALDQYGYILYIEESELAIQNYALLRASASLGSFVGKKADLVFTDGTTAVVTTDKNYNSGTHAIPDNTIVSFKEDDDGVYSLKAVSTKQVGGTNDGKYNGTMYVTGEDNFKLKNDKASIEVSDAAPTNYANRVPADTATATKNVTANSRTVFVVGDPTTPTSDIEEFTTYTGIKNAPSITTSGTANDKADIYYYCKSGSMVTVMFVLPQSAVTIEDNSNTMLYIAAKSVSDLIHDADDDYFTYNAVVNGEIATVKVADDVTVVAGESGLGTSGQGETLNGLYKSFSTNKYGVITKVTGYDTFDNTNDGKEAVNNGEGVDKRSADYTVILDTQGTPYTVTVDDNAKYFSVDKKGNITPASYRSVVQDTNDRVFAVIGDFLVQTLVVQTVESSDDAAAPTVTVAPAGPITAEVGDTVTLTASTTLSNRNDEIVGYQWYKVVGSVDSAANGETDDVKVGTNSDTYTVNTSAVAATTSYYCVVETYNDKVTGKDTAYGTSAAVSVTINAKAAPTMDVKVIYALADGTVVGTPAIDNTITAVSGRAYAVITGTAPAGYVLVGDSSQTVAFVENGYDEATFTVKGEGAITATEAAITKTTTEVVTGFTTTVSIDHGTLDTTATVTGTTDTTGEKLSVSVAADGTVTIGQATGETIAEDTYTITITGKTLDGTTAAAPATITLTVTTAP